MGILEDWLPKMSMTIVSEPLWRMSCSLAAAKSGYATSGLRSGGHMALSWPVVWKDERGEREGIKAHSCKSEGQLNAA